MSAIARLRSETWSSHQRLEKRLDVKARFSHLEGYRSYLEKMWGFCASFEEQLRQDAFGGALADYQTRRKLPRLTQDLLMIGVNPTSVALLPRCGSVPLCPDPAAAFGCAYVLEGATLGGRTLLPLVQSRLGLTAQSGATFLASYGEEVSSKWRSFGAALDAWCFLPDREACAARAAVATFEALEAWLCGSQL
jgi:heme oxygenase (biliverdin-IX-beta and delta-forming)